MKYRAQSDTLQVPNAAQSNALINPVHVQLWFTLLQLSNDMVMCAKSTSEAQVRSSSGRCLVRRN